MAKRIFRTKKKVSGGMKGKFRAWDNWKEDEYIIAKYTGTGRQDKYNKPTYCFEIEEANFASAKENAAFEKEPEIVLNSTGGFANSMENVEEDDMVQITYKGQNEIQKGKWKGEMAHAIEVLVVEEDDGSGSDEDESEEEEEDYVDL